MKEPIIFPKGVKLFDVQGIPVSLGNMPGVKFSCAAWDVSPPRVFDPGSARRNGAPVSPDKFLRLVTSARAQSPKKSTTPQDQPKILGGLSPEEFRAWGDQAIQEIVSTLNRNVLKHGYPVEKRIIPEQSAEMVIEQGNKMTIAGLQRHQRESWIAYFGSLVDRCARRYRSAAALVSLDLSLYPKLHDYTAHRIDLYPLYDMWPLICSKYNRNVYDPQRELFIGNPAPENLFANYIHWRLWPALTEENEFVRNTLRVVELLPFSDKKASLQALIITITDHPMDSELTIINPGQE